MSLLTFRDKNTSGTPVGPTWYLQFDALTIEELARTAELTQYPVETGATLSDHYQPLPRQVSLTGVVSDTPVGNWTNLEGLGADDGPKQNAAKPQSMVVRPLALKVDRDRAQRGPAGILRPVSTSILPGRRVFQSNIERARLYIPKFAQTLQVARGSLDSELNRSPRRSTATRVRGFTTVLDGLMETRTSVTVVMSLGQEYQNMFITDFRAPRIAGRSGAVTFAIDMQEVVVATAAKTTPGTERRSNAAIKPPKDGGASSPKPVVQPSGEYEHLRMSVPLDAQSGVPLG